MKYLHITDPKLIKKDRFFSGKNRNNPCPCGSGKKEKHCCMLKYKNELTNIVKSKRGE